MDAKRKTIVEALLDKAAGASDAHQAIGFAQAAYTAAQALRLLMDIESEGELTTGAPAGGAR